MRSTIWFFSLWLAAAAAPGSPLPNGAIARLGEHRFVHQSQIREVMFTPDGSVVFSQDQNEAILWDVATGERRQTYAPDSERSTAGAMSRDGRRAVFTRPGSTLEVVDVATGKPLRKIEMGSGSRVVAISDDGARIAAGLAELGVWDAASGRRIKRWKRADTAVSALRFSRDGKFLACAASTRKPILIYSVDGAEPPVQLDGGAGFSQCIEFSPDGGQVAGSCEINVGPGRHQSLLRVWDPTTGKIVREFRGSYDVCRFSPDGRLLIAGGLAEVLVFNVNTGEELQRFGDSSEHINALDISLGGKMVATGHHKRLRLWRTDTWEEVRPGTGHDERIHLVEFSPDGRTIATASHDRSVILWSWPEGKARKRMRDLGQVRGPTHLAFAPDSSKIAVSAWAPQRDGVFVFNADSGAPLLQFGLKRPSWACEFLPSGREMVAAARGGQVAIWDVATGEHVRSIGALEQDNIHSLQPLRDGSAVWWAGGYQQLGLRDLKTGEDVRHLKGGHHHSHPELVLSPDGEWLAVGDQVWDLPTGEMISGDREMPCAISPDGQLLAIYTRIWEKRTRKVLHSFGEGSDIGVTYAVTFSPDGSALVTTGDADALVWDMTGGLLSATNRRLPELALSAEQMDALWKTLASEDGWEGQKAAWRFAAGGAAAIGYLSKQLRPAEAPGADALASLRAKLRDEDFDKRELAARELIDLGIELKPEEVRLLRRPDPFAGRGSNALSLDALEAAKDLALDGRAKASPSSDRDPGSGEYLLPPPVLLPLPNRVREARAIAALERSPDPLAETLLEALSGGHPSSPLTREAASALERVRAR